MIFIALIIILIAAILLLFFKLKKVEKNKPISEELGKEIRDFMSTIDSVDVRDINLDKVEEKTKEVTDDTLDLNDLFKTMTISIVKDNSDYDFGLLKDTKK